jgi:hypothetical protein
MSDLQRSIVRTVVPAIVAAVIGTTTRFGLGLDETALTVIVTQVVTAVYYLVARLLETHVSPLWGYLLGATGAPVYDAVEIDDEEWEALIRSR